MNTQLHITIALQHATLTTFRLASHQERIVRSIEGDLSQLAGIHRIAVNLSTEMAYVSYDPKQCDPSSLTQAVADAEVRAYAQHAAPSLDSSRGEAT